MVLTNKEIWLKQDRLKAFKKILIKRRLAEVELFPTELVTNGDFSTDSDWTKGIGWTISDGKAIATSVVDTTLSQNINMQIGSRYKITVEISKYEAGTLNILAGNESISIAIVADGVYSVDLRALGNTTLYFKGSNGYIANIDNVSVKLIKEYENDWLDISKYLFLNSINTITQKLPNNLYEFGEVRIGNATFTFKNLHGEMSDENNLNSIFHNKYIRHNSLIQVIEGFVDFLTDPENPEQIENEIFQGFIDDKTAKTNDNDTESFSAKSLVSILETITIEELGILTKTNVNELVYEILNRGQFTKFFDIKQDLINAGYNTQLINISLIPNDITVLELLKKLAFGHSIFFVKNNTFFFKPAEPTSVIKHTFLKDPEKKLRVYDFNQGSKNVIENWFWEETNIKSLSKKEKFKTFKNINIDFIDDTTQRQNLLNHIREKTENPNLTFKIDLPFYPSAEFFDLIRIRRQEKLDSTGGFILDESKLDIDKLGQVLGALKFSEKSFYFIIGIMHIGVKTTLIVQEINSLEIPSIGDDFADLKMAFGNSLLKKDYGSYCVDIRRNNITDTATDEGFNEVWNAELRRKKIDIYYIDKFLNPKDFVSTLLLNDSSDTGYIEKLYDQSGNAKHITQSTFANQPIYNKTSTRFGFNGLDKLFQETSFSELSILNSFSVYTDLYINDSTTSQIVFNNRINASNLISLHIENNLLKISIYNGSIYSKSGNIATGFNYINIIWDFDTLTLRLFINGKEQIGNLAATLPTINDSFSFGALLNSPNTLFFNGDFETMLIFGKSLTDTEIQTLNLYGEQKNG